MVSPTPVTSSNELVRTAQMRRHPVNKHRSARAFRHATQRTKAANVHPRPMRGGYRL